MARLYALALNHEAQRQTLLDGTQNVSCMAHKWQRLRSILPPLSSGSSSPVVNCTLGSSRSGRLRAPTIAPKRPLALSWDWDRASSAPEPCVRPLLPGQQRVLRPVPEFRTQIGHFIGAPLHLDARAPFWYQQIPPRQCAHEICN